MQQIDKILLLSTKGKWAGLEVLIFNKLTHLPYIIFIQPLLLSKKKYKNWKEINSPNISLFLVEASKSLQSLPIQIEAAWAI